jgi:hypothetical protein
MAHFFDYAVLRVIPNQRRGECVNIGIAVFIDGGVDVRVLPTMGKVIALDANVNTAELRDLPKAIASWVGNSRSTQEKHSALRNMGIVAVTDLGRFSIAKSSGYDAMVDGLMKSLVSPVVAAGRRIPSNQRIVTTLKAKFTTQKILGADETDIAKHLVVPNYPIDSTEGLFADFALKNTVYHVTETADLRAQSSSNIERVRVASLAAIKLDKATQSFGSKTKCYVVYASNKGTSEQPINLLDDYADEIFHLDSRSEMAKYMELIMDAASHTHSLKSRQARTSAGRGV